MHVSIETHGGFFKVLLTMGQKTKSHPILLLVCHVSFHKVEDPIRGISLNRHLPIIVKGLGNCENVKTKHAFRPQQYVSNTQVPAKILKAKITVKKESRSE